MILEGQVCAKVLHLVIQIIEVLHQELQAVLLQDSDHLAKVGLLQAILNQGKAQLANQVSLDLQDRGRQDLDKTPATSSAATSERDIIPCNRTKARQFQPVQSYTAYASHLSALVQ